MLISLFVEFLQNLLFSDIILPCSYFFMTSLAKKLDYDDGEKNGGSKETWFEIIRNRSIFCRLLESELKQKRFFLQKSRHETFLFFCIQGKSMVLTMSKTKEIVFDIVWQLFILQKYRKKWFFCGFFLHFNGSDIIIFYVQESVLFKYWYNFLSM